MPLRSYIRLTKRSVDSLRVEDADRVFWDRDLAGFGVRVYASGHKVYVVQSRGVEGSRRATLGAHGTLSAEAARKQAAEVIGRIKRGEEVEPEHEGPVTMTDLAERFLRVYVAVHCKPGTARAYRGILKNHILPALGTRAVELVGRADVMALHQRLHNTPRLANNTVQVAVADDDAGGVVGTDPAGGETVPLGAPVQDSGTRAVADVRGVEPPGPGVKESRRERLGVAGRHRCDPAAGTDRVPGFGDPHAALGRRGPNTSGAEAAGQQDGDHEWCR